MADFKIKIASPCTQNWNEMAGNEQVRNCGACEKNVYNFQEMTRVEIETLLLKTEGRVCARIFKRKDGTVMTADCPVGLEAVRRKFVAAVAMCGAMLLGMLAVSQVEPSCDTRAVPTIQQRAYKYVGNFVGFFLALVIPQHETGAVAPVSDRKATSKKAPGASP